MFTGVVSAVGRAAEILGGRFRFSCPPGWLIGCRVGDSIAVNGACLTVAALEEEAFVADLSAETIVRCAPLSAGDAVNLEQALAVGDKLGGHFVTGHVDGIAELRAARVGADGCRFWRVLPPPALSPLLAEKGSVALAGVSLTVNAVGAGGEFEVCLVPHTLRQTTLSDFAVGGRLNIEADIIARHVARLAAAQPAPSP